MIDISIEPKEIVWGRQTRVRLQLRNKGPEPCYDVEIDLQFNNLRRIEGNPSVMIPAIAAEEINSDHAFLVEPSLGECEIVRKRLSYFSGNQRHQSYSLQRFAITQVPPPSPASKSTPEPLTVSKSKRDTTDTGKKDFFISYSHKDKELAEWIAYTLEKEAGFRTIFDDWDFRPGSNIVLEMQDAMERSEKTIAVLSNNYLQSKFTQPEWSNALVRDPTGAKRILVPIRIAECEVPGLLRSIKYIDLVGCEENEACSKLIKGLSSDGRPRAKPHFPGPSPPNSAGG